MEYPTVKEIERRPRQYWNADGLPDLMMGSLWILWSVAFILPELLPAGKWLGYYWMIVPLILVVSGLASNWAIKKLKQHLTFPRTGYVEWREHSAALKLLTALAGAALAAGALLLARYGIRQNMQELAPLATALLMALGFLFLAVWQKLPHYLFPSVVSLALAGIISIVRLDMGNGLILLFFCLGVLLSLIGGIRLRSYLRQNPPPVEGEV
jgi:hypothetical protein